MRKIAIFKLLKQGYVYIYIDSITAFRVFGEHSRIYTAGGEVFDVEDTIGNIVEIIMEVGK